MEKQETEMKTEGR